MTVSQKAKRSSHVGWYLTYGEWPKYLCHRCDRPACVNPDHLFEGDHNVNQYDRKAKGAGGVMVP